jgi:hypothetical protein
MNLIVFLAGLSLAWVCIRFLSDLPRRLPKLLELMGEFILHLLARVVVWLLTTILTRAYRSLLFLLSTPEAQRWRHRLEVVLRKIISTSHQKSKS